jgi:hypothetical protein
MFKERKIERAIFIRNSNVRYYYYENGCLKHNEFTKSRNSVNLSSIYDSIEDVIDKRLIGTSMITDPEEIDKYLMMMELTI